MTRIGGEAFLAVCWIVLMFHLLGDDANLANAARDTVETFGEVIGDVVEVARRAARV